MNAMFEKVNKLLEQYIGGDIFFTELDNAVKFTEQCGEITVSDVFNAFPFNNEIFIGYSGSFVLRKLF